MTAVLEAMSEVREWLFLDVDIPAPAFFEIPK